MFTDEFFPTPGSISYRMFQKVSKNAKHFLEPSAGKGDIAEQIRRQRRYATIDCIEQQPELAAILADKDFPVVGHDWLDYSGVCYYDAILMNPPFSNGDKHLLRAWDFMHNGEIVCLLNEETIKNPHTADRQRLVALIEKHGNVEYLGDCFRKAQRTTGVKVAMVYLKKISNDDTLEMWASETTERDPNADIGADANMLAIRDRLGNMQHYYDKANDHMIKAFQHIRRAALYMDQNEISSPPGTDWDKIIGLAWRNVNDARAEFIRAHRQGAWMSVFDLMDFRKWLDKRQTDQFVRDIERNGNVPFTKENIKGTLQNVFLQRGRLFEQSVANVFDELTRYYKGNTNHHEGWKTNDNYMVNRKIIFPYGCRFETKYGRSFGHCYGSQIDIYNDLDRILSVISGQDFAECYTIYQAMDTRFRALGYNVTSPFNNECESEYFHIKFFMKGTVHLTFKNKELWARFNITAAKGKTWIGRNTQEDVA